MSVKTTFALLLVCLLVVVAVKYIGLRFAHASLQEEMVAMVAADLLQPRTDLRVNLAKLAAAADPQFEAGNLSLTYDERRLSARLQLNYNRVLDLWVTRILVPLEIVFTEQRPELGKKIDVMTETLDAANKASEMRLSDQPTD